MRLCCSYDYHTNRPTIQLSIVCLKADGFVESVYCERANERRTLKAKVRTEMRLCCSYDYHTNRPTIQLSIVCLKADGFVESVYCERANERRTLKAKVRTEMRLCCSYDYHTNRLRFRPNDRHWVDCSLHRFQPNDRGYVVVTTTTPTDRTENSIGKRLTSGNLP